MLSFAYFLDIFLRAFILCQMSDYESRDLYKTQEATVDSEWNWE